MAWRARPKGATLLSVPALVAACAVPAAAPDPAVPVVTAEVYELANIRAGNVVPKSSPATLVATFEKYCLEGSHAPARISRALRAADYVAVPKGKPGPITAFVVDDSRPMVMLADDGRSCAVAAASRTGQSARIQSMIASRFPQAQALDPPEVGANTELAVHVTGANAGVIFVQRLAPTVSHSRLILGIVREG